jgi:hypothetical protein
MMRFISFFAQLSIRFIMNIHGVLNLGPMVLTLGLTTTKTLWLMISSENSLLRGGLTFGLNFGTSLLARLTEEEQLRSLNQRLGEFEDDD